MSKIVSIIMLLPLFVVAQKKISKQHVDIYYPYLVETNNSYQKFDEVISFKLKIGNSNFVINTIKSCYFEDSNLIIINSSNIYPDSIISVDKNHFVIRNDKSTYRQDTINLETGIVYDGVIEIKSLFVFDKRLNKCVMINPIIFENNWKTTIRNRMLKKIIKKARKKCMVRYN